MFSSIFVCVAIIAVAFDKSDGATVRQTRPLASKTFDEITISGGFVVSLTQLPADGKEEASVDIETTEEIHRYVVVDVQDGHILSIRLQGPVITYGSPKVFIRFVTPLTRCTVEGGGKMFTEKNGLSNPKDVKFVIDKSGGTDMDLKMDVYRFEALFSGSGDIRLEGQVRSESLFDISGSPNVDALKLNTKKSTVQVHGSGVLRVAASEDLEIDSSGSSEVFYQLPAEKKPSKMDSSGLASIERLSSY